MSTAVDVNRVFVALADPTRRRVLELLGHSPATASALARELPVTRQGILKHLVVLRESGLVAGERAGREVRFQVRPESLVAAASWMTSLAATWDERLALLKHHAEHQHHVEHQRHVEHQHHIEHKGQTEPGEGRND